MRAPGVRRRRTPLLPRYRAGELGAEDHARGDAQALPADTARGQARCGAVAVHQPAEDTPSTSVNDFNAAIIEEFRANGGKVAGRFEGAPLLLLTSTGAKSGEARTTPVMYLPDGERMAIFASKAGAPTNPAWYHNLLANPSATVEVGTPTVEVAARVVSGEERGRLFTPQAGCTRSSRTTRRKPRGRYPSSCCSQRAERARHAAAEPTAPRV